VRAVALARELRPDVCLFDVRMPELDGIEATRLLAGPGVEDPMAIVVITTFDLDEYVRSRPARAASCSRTRGRSCSYRRSTAPPTAMP
jgi:DNA-binding NarL/FixJ family response regulator